MPIKKNHKVFNISKSWLSKKIPRYKVILDTGKLKCNNYKTYKTTTKQEQKHKIINKTVIKVLMEITMKIIMAMITVLIKNIG